MKKVKYLKCSYDQWDEAMKKASHSGIKKKSTRKHTKAKAFKNLYAR